MTIITKAALADELSISWARVSQYVKAGLPVRLDGQLNRAEALNWLHTHAVGFNSFEDRGVNRAGRLARGAKAPARQPEQRTPIPVPAPDLDLREVLVAVLQRVEAVVAFSAVAANGSMETAYTIAEIARLEMFGALTDLAHELSAPDSFDGPLGRVGPTEYPPDWAALADRAGDPVDLDRWREAERRLPHW